MVTQWQQSGLTQRAFCEGNNIAYHSFHYWYKVYKQDQTATHSFLPVKVVDLNDPELMTLRGKSGIELQLPLSEKSVSFIKTLLS